MFRWLANLIDGPDLLAEANRRLGEDLLEDQRREEVRKQKERQKPEDPWLVRHKKKQRLEQELKDAEWILDYECRLAKVQKQGAREIDHTEDRGRSPKRLQKLQSHLCDVRRSITRD